MRIAIDRATLTRFEQTAEGANAVDVLNDVARNATDVVADLEVVADVVRELAAANCFAVADMPAQFDNVRIDLDVLIPFDSHTYTIDVNANVRWDDDVAERSLWVHAYGPSRNWAPNWVTAVGGDQLTYLAEQIATQINYELESQQHAWASFLAAHQ